MLTDAEKLERIRSIVDDDAGWQLAASQLQQKIIDILNGKDEKVESREQIERIRDAKNVIAKAIQQFQDIFEDGEYVTAWIVLTERTSIELEQSNSSVVGTLVPTGQNFVTTRGLLDIALTNERTQSGRQ